LSSEASLELSQSNWFQLFVFIINCHNI